MRVVTNGFEFGSLNGNYIQTLDPDFTISTSGPRQTASFNGGSRFLNVSTSSAKSIPFAALPYSQTQSFFKISQRLEGIPTLLEYRFFDGVTEVFRISSSAGNPFNLYVGGILVDSGNVYPNTFVWQEIEIGALIDVSGTITLKLDGLTDISYSGNTTTGSTSWDNFDFYVNGAAKFDDMIINDTYTVLKYDGGNGIIPSGTVTGGGGNGTIIYHVGDGITGYMVIDNSGSAFIDNTPITDGSFTGNAFGDEETANTSAPSTSSYIQVLLPNGNGTTSGLSGTDGNSIDNYALVNTIEDVTDSVFSGTPSDFDTYNIENIPEDAVSINYVESCFYSRKDGSVVPNIRSVIRTNSTNYDSPKQAVGSSYSWIKFPYQVNPDTDSAWSISDVNNLEVGPKVES